MTSSFITRFSRFSIPLLSTGNNGWKVAEEPAGILFSNTAPRWFEWVVKVELVCNSVIRKPFLKARLTSSRFRSGHLLAIDPGGALVEVQDQALFLRNGSGDTSRHGNTGISQVLTASIPTMVVPLPIIKFPTHVAGSCQRL